MGEFLGAYECCQLKTQSYFDLPQIVSEYEQFCDNNYEHITHIQDILDFGQKNGFSLETFRILATFCPERMINHESNKTPWAKIEPAMHQNDKISDSTLLEGECKEVEITSIDKSGSLTIFYGNDDMFFGHLAAFIGPIDRINEKTLFEYMQAEDLSIE